LRTAELVSINAVPVALEAAPVTTRAALVSIFAALVCLAGWGAPAWGQVVDGAGGVGRVQSYGFSTSYSKTSSHILIGDAGQRRIWTLGVEYTHLLHQGQRFRLDYEGSLMPLFEETDPTVTGTIFTYNGQSFITPQTPVRVISVTHEQVGSVPVGAGLSVPLYALYGRQDTYAAACAPLGARISALPRWRVQPSFALDLGFVVSARDIPVDEADQFNYMFSLGPGVQFFSSPKASVRVEYIYRHVSNAHQGYENPGVDQGVFRLTVSRHW
jgi:opacity protein-like surface antigen